MSNVRAKIEKNTNTKMPEVVYKPNLTKQVTNHKPCSQRIRELADGILPHKGNKPYLSGLKIHLRNIATEVEKLERAHSACGQ